MARHHVHDTSWGVIDFDGQSAAVFVQQKWNYIWKLWPGVTAPWTHREKEHFHSTVDKQIWGTWSNTIRLSVAGSSTIARRLLGRQVTMNFDVKWVLAAPFHWTINAWKMPAGTAPTSPHRSAVIVATKVIELNTADLAPRGAGNQAGASTAKFRTAPHEFGHAIVSGGVTANPDEYVNTSGDVNDTSSIMNIGRELRKRHLTEVVGELNKLVPDLMFSIVAPAL
jgi:hypothetical protein